MTAEDGRQRPASTDDVMGEADVAGQPSSDGDHGEAAGGGAGVRGAADAPRREPRGAFLRTLRDLAIIVVIALALSTLLRTFVVRTFSIPSGSMEQTLQVGDRVLVNRMQPNPFGLSRGDVVVFRDPGGWLSTPPGASQGWSLGRGVQDALTFVGLGDSDSQQYLIKRVIGVEGDHVVCSRVGGTITVNDVELDESAYVNPGNASCARTFDVTVPADSIWVMGDNRGNSRDSSAHTSDPGHGTVPVDDVVGRAFVVSWPASRWQGLDAHPEVFADVPDRSDLYEDE
ncbi:signal peptidase I [Pseudoclavibacter caeni]|jgi:signal peptidase I|nr:signal peptidase I [Pseudoclavibacter caeni]NYJ97549.1 signal peptidase I [Pseudoclavibacter caeni]